MKVEFLKEFEAKTAAGSRTITAGTVLDLSPEKAERLVRAGIAAGVDEKARPRLEGETLVIPFNAPVKYRWWQDGQPVEETLRELFEERAAIMEIDGGLSREEAEREAARSMARYAPRYPYQEGGERDERT